LKRGKEKGFSRGHERGNEDGTFPQGEVETSLVPWQIMKIPAFHKKWEKRGGTGPPQTLERGQKKSLNTNQKKQIHPSKPNDDDPHKTNKSVIMGDLRKKKKSQVETKIPASASN